MSKEDAPPSSRRAFEEAERALAVLEGKDPKLVRQGRQVRLAEQQAFDERAARVEDARKQASELRHLRVRAWLARGAIAVLVTGMAGAALWLAWTRRGLEESARAAVSTRARGLAAAGLTLADVALPKSGAIALDVTVDGCAAFVGATGSEPLPLTVQSGERTLEGDRVLLCTCSAEPVHVAAKGATMKSALGVLRGTAPGTGGILGLRTSKLEGVVVDEPPECAEAQLDAWVQAAAASRPTAPPEGGVPLEKPLASVGFDLVLHVGPEAPLAVVPGDKDRCFVAAASEPSAVLSLRQTGGGEVARGGVLAWCDGEATSRIVRRKGGGTITVASADVARIGGLVGAVEASRAAGLSAPSTWLPRGALGPAVTHALRATGILPTSIFATDAVSPEATVRLVAIARSDGPPSEDGKGLACSPAWPGASALCVLPAGRGWERPPYKAALAVAPLPPWATVLATVTDRRALEDVSALLVLSRRLAREGFEPTILENVKELPLGADVMGRAGEDAVVAVALSPTPPHVVPLTDGAAWRLDTPRIVPLAPGARAMLIGKVLPMSPATTRRTVVFRRTKK